MGKNISWNVEAKIKKGKLDDLKKWIKQASSQVKKNEFGTLAYEFWLSPDKKTINYYNRYLNSESLILHMNNISPLLPELLKLGHSVSVADTLWFGNYHKPHKNLNIYRAVEMPWLTITFPLTIL